jgi:hypothetical protein
MGRRPIAGFILSLISGIFIILNAALLSLAHILTLSLHLSIRQPPWFWDRFLEASAWLLLTLAVYGAVCGLIILIGSYCLYRGRNLLGGVLIILFSILSLPIGGGFILGFLLGVVGGALALAGI